LPEASGLFSPAAARSCANDVGLRWSGPGRWASWYLHKPGSPGAVDEPVALDRPHGCQHLRISDTLTHQFSTYARPHRLRIEPDAAETPLAPAGTLPETPCSGCSSCRGARLTSDESSRPENRDVATFSVLAASRPPADQRRRHCQLVVVRQIHLQG
jgi:hypothetical protein